MSRQRVPETFSSNTTRLNLACGCVTWFEEDCVKLRFCTLHDAAPDLRAASIGAENTLRGMSHLVDSFDNEDDAVIMLHKADCLRDAIAKANEDRRMVKSSPDEQEEMRLQHVIGQFIAEFSENHRERISCIAEHGPDYSDDNDAVMCRIMACFIRAVAYGFTIELKVFEGLR